MNSLRTILIPSEELGHIEKGDTLRLLPDNESFDEYAVKVLLDDVHIGWIPNKGSTCETCGTMTKEKFVCLECGSDKIVKLGPAYCLRLNDVYNKNYVAIVDEITSVIKIQIFWPDDE